MPAPYPRAAEYFHDHAQTPAVGNDSAIVWDLAGGCVAGVG